MINQKKYLEEMKDLLKMRRRTNMLLNRINSFSDEKYEEVEDEVYKIYDELDRSEELLVVFAAYKYKSLFGEKFKDWSEEDFEQEYDYFYPEVKTRLDNAVTFAEDIVFDPDDIKGINKNQRQLLKMSYNERVDYINDKKETIYKELNEKSDNDQKAADMLKEFINYEETFNNSLKEYNGWRYVEREKYNDMFLLMDSNMSKLAKKIKKNRK